MKFNTNPGRVRSYIKYLPAAVVTTPAAGRYWGFLHQAPKRYNETTQG